MKDDDVIIVLLSFIIQIHLLNLNIKFTLQSECFVFFSTKHISIKGPLFTAYIADLSILRRKNNKDKR